MAGTTDARANGHPPRNADDDLPLVLQALNKKLRNAKKRLRGVEEIQAKADAGKEINQDQVSLMLQLPQTRPRRSRLVLVAPRPLEPPTLPLLKEEDAKMDETRHFSCLIFCSIDHLLCTI